jgi:hypothetical protein
MVGKGKGFLKDTNMVKSICHKVLICVPEKTFAEWVRELGLDGLNNLYGLFIYFFRQ